MITMMQKNMRTKSSIFNQTLNAKQINETSYGQYDIGDFNIVKKVRIQKT